MIEFMQHTIDTAPQAAWPLLEATEKAWGFVPNLQATLAESPATLEAYETLFGLVGKSALSPGEQQVALLAVSVFHECEYCTAGHTFLARRAGVPEQAIEALRGGAAIADRRFEVLRSFAEAVVRERGFVGENEVEAFVAAGFSKAQILDVVLIAATKTISNYVNRIARTPPESFMADPALKWVAPRQRKSAA